MKDPLVLGFVLIMVDVVLWRAAFPRHDTIRLLLRLVIFALLSALLFGSTLSPFSPAPWPESPGRHLAAQILEVSWWLIGARLLTMSLDAAFQSRQWHRERLFQDVLGALVFLAAVVASLAFVLGLPVTGLVATSGALAIVLGLAIQSTLSDVFAGIVLNTTEPYHIGDWVSVDGVDGKVLEMNWRATHLLTSHGNVVIVPNSVAAKAKITNSSRPVALHGVSVALQISPEERPASVLGALQRAIAGSNMVLQTPAPYALIKKASINSIEYEVTVYIDDISKSVTVTNQLYDLCHRHLAAAGIELWPLSAPRPPRHDVADSRQRLLSHVDLFRALPSEEIEALSKRLSRHEYEVNQEVVKAEEVMDYLMIVESGVLSVVVKGPSGPIESTRLGPGDSIGEAGVLAGLPVQAQVTALTRTLIYRLDKADLTPLLKSRPEIGQQMCHVLSQQQDTLRKLNTELPAPVGTEHSLLDWLRDGMRKLHELTG
ncbi:mechanosensitive ion channel domain-containing protein [Caballeronia sp. 15711]|uniref:mechanosensitive ion channel domain-containing protein n=1 Tax=Caballeronia sp. 15711 TaxID=3391029 RepID=UPI0039E42952